MQLFEEPISEFFVPTMHFMKLVLEIAMKLGLCITFTDINVFFFKCSDKKI